MFQRVGIQELNSMFYRERRAQYLSFKKKLELLQDFKHSVRGKGNINICIHKYFVHLQNIFRKSRWVYKCLLLTRRSEKIAAMQITIRYSTICWQHPRAYSGRKHLSKKTKDFQVEQ